MPRLWQSLTGIVLLLLVAHGVTRLVAQDSTSQPPESPLAVEPEENSELLESAILMADFGRYDLARQYLKTLVDSNLDDDALLQLRDQYGTSELYSLSRTAELQPEAGQLLQQVQLASQNRATDPARIDRILQDLNKSPRERELAIIELKNLGIAIMPRLIEHLSNPDAEFTRDQITGIILELGRRVTPALLGALPTENLELKTALLSTIGVLGSDEDVEELWYYAYGENQQPAIQSAARASIAQILFDDSRKTKYVSGFGVQKKLKTAAREYFRGQHSWETNDQGRVDLWIWNEGSGTVQPVSVTPAAANLSQATKFSGQALSFPGEDPELQALFLSAILADAGYRAGWEQSLPTGPGTAFNLALTSGVPTLQRAVELSLDAGQIRAAETALTALSRIGDDQLIYSGPDQASVIVKGLNSPDPRVQFSAAVAALQLDPQTPFRSSSRVVDVLTRALNDDGTRQVLVIDPNQDRGQEIAAATSQMGYSALNASTGKEGFETAARRGDVALVLMHLNCVDWELSQTLANFRADARTAGMPLVIYGPSFMQDEVTLNVRNTPNSTYIVYSNQGPEIDRQLRPFLQAQISPPLSNSSRTRRTAAAVYWLSQIAEQWNDYFDLAPAVPALAQALNTPELISDALATLKSIPTREAQIVLAETVLRDMNDPETRIEAAYFLGPHIRKHGLLIEDEVLARLKEIWQNDSNPELQTAIASVVGSLRPNTAMTEKRLESFQFPTLPAAN